MNNNDLEAIKDDVAFDYGYISWDNYVKTDSFKSGGIEFNNIFKEVVKRCVADVEAYYQNLDGSWDEVD